MEARGWVQGLWGQVELGRGPALCTENLGPGHPATFHVSSAGAPPSPTQTSLQTSKHSRQKSISRVRGQVRCTGEQGS